MKRNLLLISIDSVRPEAIGAVPDRFGWSETFPYKVATPTLDWLAREGVLLTNLITQAPYTPASHASFLTGLNPPSHGIRGFFGYRLSEHTRTLAERLENEGYRTGAFVGSDALNPRYGLGRGFDVYDAEFERKMDGWPRGDHRRDGAETTQKALQWMQQECGPFFAFIHYFDVHDLADHVYLQADPVANWLRQGRDARFARGPIRRWLQRLETGYAHRRQRGKPFHVRQTQRVDRLIGRLVRDLIERRIYDETIIVVMSDHGDAFGEHGEFGHRQHLYDTTLRVPLILKAVPEHRNMKVTAPVRSIDLVPTVCDLLELRDESTNGHQPIEGTSLLSLIEGADHQERPAYSETRMEKSLQQLGELKSHRVSLRTSRWKLIADVLNGSRELYDLAQDPTETRNLAGRHASVGERLYTEAMRIHDNGEQDTTDLSGDAGRELEQVKLRLHDLGYI